MTVYFTELAIKMKTKQVQNSLQIILIILRCTTEVVHQKPHTQVHLTLTYGNMYLLSL